MDKYESDSFGERLAWARKKLRKMTQDEFARQVHVRKVYVSQLETNIRTPSLQLLIQMAKVLGVTVGWLLMETDQPFPGGQAIDDLNPMYISPEADAIATLVDDLEPIERKRVLSVVQAMAGPTLTNEQEPPAMTEEMQTAFAHRLILGRAARQGTRV